MNTMTKLALVGASIVSIGALTACQSTDSAKGNHHPRMMKDHSSKHEHKLTTEQREQFRQARGERKQVFEQIKKACDGKAAGQIVQIKAGDKTLDGTCAMTFKADHKAMKQHGQKHHMKGEYRSMRADQTGSILLQRGEPITDAKRAELTKQFDQRLAERQAKQQALFKACQGQNHGQTVQVKLNTQTINGKCEVRFQPQPTAYLSPSAKAML